MRLKDNPNTFRTVYTLISLYCLAIFAVTFLYVMVFERMTVDDCLWTKTSGDFTTQQGVIIVGVTEGGTAEAAGIKNNDILLEINDERFETVAEAQKILNKYDQGDEVIYTIIREGVIYRIPIEVYKNFNLQYLIFSLLGLGFLVIGFMVAYTRPLEFISKLFFALGCSALFAFNILGTPISFPGSFFLYNLLAGLYIFFPVFLHFFITFPVNYNWSFRRQLLTITYTLPISIFFLQFVLQMSPLIIAVINFVLFSYLFTGIGLFFHSYFKKADANKRASLKFIFYGLIAGGFGLFYTIAVPFILKTPNLFIKPWVLLPAVLVLAIPVSFGYSIIRYRLLDSELIIKKGLIFGITTAVIVALYLAFIFLVDNFLAEYAGNYRQLISILLIILITFTFDFVNKKAKDIIDRQFYKERYNYRRSLLEFSDELPYLNNFNDILSKLGRSVYDTMGIKTLNVWIKDMSYYNLIEQDTHQSNIQENKRADYDEAFTILHKENFEPRLTYRMNLEEYNIPDNLKQLIIDNDVVLSIPIIIKNRLVGSLNFGDKPSGKAYSDEDLDLLKTLASQSAIAFENARLQIEELNKRKIEEELQIARKIQQGLLPKENNLMKGLQISAAYLPAKEVGGDLYDIIKISEDKVLVVVADVSGSGIPAALYMAKLQAMIQFAARIYNSPSDILIEVNKKISQVIDKKTFITVVIALFDIKQQTVSICRAGQNPVLYKSNGSVEAFKNNGIGLGIGTAEQFQSSLYEMKISLKQDSVFLFYSDGLIKSVNGSNKLSQSALNSLLQKPGNDPEEIKKDILESLQKNSGNHPDDVTFVVVKIKNEI